MFQAQVKSSLPAEFRGQFSAGLEQELAALHMYADSSDYCGTGTGFEGLGQEFLMHEDNQSPINPRPTRT